MRRRDYETVRFLLFRDDSLRFLESDLLKLTSRNGFFDLTVNPANTKDKKVPAGCFSRSIRYISQEG
jgi:hypothetical protein